MKSGSRASSFAINIFIKSSCSIASIDTSVWQHTVAVRLCALIKATSYDERADEFSNNEKKIYSSGRVKSERRKVITSIMFVPDEEKHSYTK